MNRRLMSIARDPVYFVALIVLTIACHIQWHVTDILTLNFYPLAFLCVAFVGYKYGKIYSMLVTAISFAFYLLIKIRYQEYLAENAYAPVSNLFTSVIALDNIRLMGQSLWDFALLTIFGLLATLAIDWLESKLHTVKLTLDDILPYQHGFYLARIVSFFRYFFVTKDDHLSAEAQLNFNLPYGVKLNIKLLMKRVLFTLSLPLLLILSFQYDLRIIDELSLHFTPYYTAIPLIMIFCWYRGALQTMWLLAFLSLAAFAVLLSTDGGYLTDAFQLDPLFSSFGVVAITMITAWWLDKFHQAWNNPLLKRKILRLSFFSRFRRQAGESHYFPVGASLVMLLCTFSVQLAPEQIAFVNHFFADAVTTTEMVDQITAQPDYITVSQTDYIYYNPLLMLLFIVLYYCQRYNPYSISNTLLLMLLLQSLITLNSAIFFDDYDAVTLHLFYYSIIQILSVCLVPVFYRYFVVASLADIRQVLIIISLINMLFGLVTGDFQSVLVLSFGNEPQHTLIALLIHFCLIELGARLLFKLANKTSDI